MYQLQWHTADDQLLGRIPGQLAQRRCQLFIDETNTVRSTAYAAPVHTD